MTTTQQDQDVIDLLLTQHRQIRDLFAEVRNATGEPRQRAFHRLVRLLAVHESAEELVVHPASRHDATNTVVDACLREENDAKRELTNLYALGTDAPGFDERFARFERAVLAHAAHEEQQEFPMLRRRTDPAKLRRMAGAVRAAEAVSPTRPHAGVGESATTMMLAGPPMALFDRMRDAIRDWHRTDND
ncbi:hemerythrin domain-containing protein [Actinoplanes teichomyceticus]|uniref:Hemerythrin HHE cation binding domain-containing protein n=1 Tax=Actinoplanes teichomyceticus TaxID=1867 RepID=A0A561WQY6_ACTTI|nr:hemerythrin domain-containing protein [Actinoplanes teichomyceticus]TWG26277.1 hemerythrin HHE cation binding domain-containing protein [Actinoplanes teichomyceticus]GIF11356.1 hemerythrin [Actinoplanes teichomyceticus]